MQPIAAADELYANWPSRLVYGARQATQAKSSHPPRPDVLKCAWKPGEKPERPIRGREWWVIRETPTVFIVTTVTYYYSHPHPHPPLPPRINTPLQAFRGGRAQLLDSQSHTVLVFIVERIEWPFTFAR